MLKAIKDLISVTIGNDMHLLVLSTFYIPYYSKGCLKRFQLKYSVCVWVGGGMGRAG